MTKILHVSITRALDFLPRVCSPVMSRIAIRRAAKLRTIAAGIIGAGILGCGSSDEVAPLLQDSFAQIDLNVRSVLMSTVAPYNTLQIEATARSFSGAPVTGTTPPKFITKDGTRSVSPDGVVTALGVTPGSTPTWVAVSIADTLQNLTITDTVYITVTDQSPASTLQTFKFLPTRGDSAKFGIASSQFNFPKDTIKSLGNEDAAFTSQLKIRYRSLDSTTVQIHPTSGALTLKRVGSAVIEATTTYYGVTKTITLPIKVGLPYAVEVVLDIQSSPTAGGKYIRNFSPNTVVIGVGGTVAFDPQNVADKNPAREIPWDLIFDDPASAEKTSLPLGRWQDSVGNVDSAPPLVVNNSLNPACISAGIRPICNGARRAFRRPGTYIVRSALYGTVGKIIVQGEP